MKVTVEIERETDGRWVVLVIPPMPWSRARGRGRTVAEAAARAFDLASKIVGDFAGYVNVDDDELTRLESVCTPAEARARIDWAKQARAEMMRPKGVVAIILRGVDKAHPERISTIIRRVVEEDMELLCKLALREDDP